MAEKYYFGQGKVYFADLDADGNRVGNFRWVGNVPSLQLALAVEKIEKQESYSGKRNTVRSIITSQTATINASFDQFDAENLSSILNGVAIAKTTSTPISGASLGTASSFKAGDMIALHDAAGQEYVNVSAVSLEAGSTPLELGVHYDLDARAGAVTFLDLSSLTGTIMADFTPGPYTIANILTKNTVNKALRYIGLNIAEVDSNGEPERVIVDLFKVQMDPTSDLQLINEEFASFPVTGTALVDSNRSASGELGQFGAIRLVS